MFEKSCLRRNTLFLERKKEMKNNKDKVLVVCCKRAAFVYCRSLLAFVLALSLYMAMEMQKFQLIKQFPVILLQN